MKKFFLTVITFIYLLMSSGIAMDVHYCMGKRAGVDFYSQGDTKCGKCGMTEKKGGCCHDEHRFVKLDNDHRGAVAIDSPAVPISEAAEISFFQIEIFLPYSPIILTPAHAPPDIPPVDLCVRNCVFRV